MKKIIDFVKEYKFVIIAYLCVLVLIAPMINMFRFAVINAEDFLYGIYPHRIWEDTHSFFRVAVDAAQRTFHDYFSWQGSFVSVFLMYMQPGIFSTGAYRVCMFVMFLMSLVCPYIALKAFNKHLLCADKKIILIIYALFLIVLTQYMPNAYQAWYWYNGAIYYQFTFNLIMLFLALAISLPHMKRKPIKTISIVLMFILVVLISASNYITSVALIACYAVYIALAYKRKYENRALHTWLLGLYLAIFLINVMAPGNGGRATMYVQPSLPLIAIFSVRDFFAESSLWISTTITAASIIAASVFAKDLVKNSKIKFINPWLMLILVLAILIGQYAPTIYGLGHKGPPRTTNIRFMTLQISLWAMAVNLFGYLHKKNKLIKVNPIMAVMLSVVVLASSINLLPLTETWGYKSLDSYIGGTLKIFSTEMDYRIKTLEDKSIDKPIEFTNAVTNEMLHPNEDLWWDWGVWTFYRKTHKQ